VKTVRTGIGLWGNRFVPPQMTMDYARSLEATGHIDQLVVWDQLNSWFPNSLWKPEYTPLAAMLPDVDSSSDPFATIAFGLAATENMGWAVATDALRRQAPELAQTVLTLAGATGTGQSTLCLGAGEERHVSAFGRKRSLGLRHVEDALQVLRLLLKERGLVDHDGKVWKMKNAWIGNGGKDHKPEVCAMGGGPRLSEAAVRYADGWTAGAPFVFGRPEAYGEAVKEKKQQLADIGRDPEAFTFGLHHIIFLAPSKAEFEKHIDNPLVKWYAATGGRLHMRQWPEEEGIESVMPLDWRYNFDMRPVELSEADVLKWADQVTPEMVRKTFFHGTPEEVAAEIIPYVKAGSELNLIADVSGLIVPQDPAEAARLSGEICRLVKEGAAA
jgi:phthiodiolone/phenolphthiodiolone dimycocerosates ketoreductase